MKLKMLIKVLMTKPNNLSWKRRPRKLLLKLLKLRKQWTKKQERRPKKRGKENKLKLKRKLKRLSRSIKQSKKPLNNKEHYSNRLKMLKELKPTNVCVNLVSLEQEVATLLLELIKARSRRQLYTKSFLQ